MTANTIIDIFVFKAKEKKEQVCLVVDNKEYTYQIIDELSNGYAKRIIETLARSNTPILVFCDNPIQIVCSIIGAMKSKNVVVPVINDTPISRILDIVSACNIGGYISTNEHKELTVPFISTENVTPCDYEYHGNAADDAYIIYTSGTTGKSKGVLVQHKGLVNSVTARNEILGIDSHSHSINLMGTSFDGFLMSLFSPLIAGAKLFFPRSITDLKEICSIIKNSSISTLLCTPTFLKGLLNFAEEGLLNNVKLISLAGEQISHALVDKMNAIYPFVQLANEYGPTENSICTSINPDIRGQKVFTVGKPIKNVKAKILNGVNDCKYGEIGELYLSGTGLAKGYVNDEALTNEKFIKSNGQTWYNTGDLAYWLDSELVIVGRSDSQVKVNGYRVDLYEIENAILKFEGIDDCVVLCEEENSLTAYMVSSLNISSDLIINFLRQYLAEYMIPTKYNYVENIPMRASGKIDSLALKKMCHIQREETNTCLETIVISKNICSIFEDILKLSKCDINDNFYALGGDSLTGIILCERIQERFKVGVKIEDVRSNATPWLLAKRILNMNEDSYFVAIEPFNKFWFIDCYYTSILGVLEYYYIPIVPFIRSFIIKNVELNDTYYLWYDYKQPLMQVFAQLGMKYEPGILENDFEEKIINHIMKHRVVMLHMDCFYIPYCKEKYQKEHFEHVVAIVGYDKEHKVFDIIDQENLESVSFTHHKVDLDSLKASAYAEIVNRKTFDNMDFVAIYPLDNIDYAYDNQNLDNSQFNFVVEETIKYLRKNPQKVRIVLQRLMNYLKIEECVFEHMNENEKVKFLKNKESQLLRFFMRMLRNTEDEEWTKSLVDILVKWEKF